MRKIRFKSLLTQQRTTTAAPVNVTGQILLEDILTPNYLRRYLGIGDLPALLSAAGVDKLADARMATLNKVVRARSSFLNWEEMISHASGVYIENKYRQK